QLTTTTVQARASPLLNNFFGTDNTGLIGYDAKFNNYAAYLQLLVNTVALQWDRIVDQSSFYPERGTRVEVKFRLNSRGEIAEVISVTSNGNRDAQTSCVSAITARAPYGAWSADMIATLGESQALTFAFYYD